MLRIRTQVNRNLSLWSEQWIPQQRTEVPKLVCPLHLLPFLYRAADTTDEHRADLYERNGDGLAVGSRSVQDGNFASEGVNQALRRRGEVDAPSRRFLVKTSRSELTVTGLTVCHVTSVRQSRERRPSLAGLQLWRSPPSTAKVIWTESTHIVRALDARGRAHCAQDGRMISVIVGGREAEDGNLAILELRRKRGVAEEIWDGKLLSLCQAEMV